MAKRTRGVSRRDFFKGGALLGASLASAGVLSGCGAMSRPESAAGTQLSNGMRAVESVSAAEGTGASSTYDYDAMTGKSAAAGDHYDFKYLGTPMKIGSCEIRNRIVKSAASSIESRFDDSTGQYCPGAIEFYRNLAKGGTGLIIHDVVDFKDGTSSTAPFRTEDDIAIHKPYIDAVHQEGAKLFLQFFSPDNADASRYTGVPSHPHGSSTYAQAGATQGMNMLSPEMWTTEEVEEQTQLWANGIALAQKAGFDGVEINLSSNHIGANFTSRYWNRERTDKYGSQTIDNLCRFGTEILDKARALVGRDFPMGVLINGHEWDVFTVGNNERCNSIALQCELAKRYVAHGADYIHVRSAAWGAHMLDILPDVAFMNGEPDTGYGHPLEIERFWPEFIQDYRGAGGFINTAAIIKQAAGVPVITTGMMDVRLIPDVIDEAIGAGKIDFIGMTRRLFADPDYASKAIAGDLCEIRPCANCVSCWHDYCRVNAALVRAGNPDMPEGYVVQKTSTPKNVLIAGGGPAGLEAAHVAAERGHHVTIVEKDDHWGGLTRVAMAYKGKNEKIADHIQWLVRQCQENGVDMALGTEVTKDFVSEQAPDVLIDATGGKKSVPDIEGIGGENVHVVGAGDVVDGNNVPGQKISVIGGRIYGIQVAIFLAKLGKEVVVIDSGSSDVLGDGIPGELKPKYLCWCQTHGVRTLTGATVKRINQGSIDVVLNYGLEQSVECDNVLVALPVEADPSLANECQGVVPEVHAIGNASSFGLIREAVRDGNLLARYL